jgi:hypothetical protein
MRSRILTGLMGAVATAGVALASATSAGAAAQIQAKLQLTSSRPGTPTGAVLNLERPDGPDGKPKTEAEGVFQLPPGTTVNQDAVPPCTKDDTTWQAQGQSACPSSFVGTGFVTLVSGLGPPVDPYAIDQHWYYAPGQLVSLYTNHGQDSPVLKVGRVQIKGATFDAPLDLPPGYPPGTKTSPKATDVTINRFVGPRGAFITTPPTCPPAGKWVTTVFLTYGDGSTDTVRDATPCQRAGGPRRCGSDSPHAYITRRTLRASRRGVFVRGHSFGTCGTAPEAVVQVVRINVAVARVQRDGCRFLTTRGSLSRLRSCRRPLAMAASGTRNWRWRRRARLPRGRYRLYAWALDSVGRREPMPRRPNARFTVR